MHQAKSALATGVALVVDDSASIRAAVRAHLEALGFAVTAVASAEEAFKEAVTRPPRIVISDVRMAGLSGVHLARLIRSDPELARTPIILLTAENDPRSRFWGRHAGADAYITKEHALAELTQTIERVLERRRPDSERARPRPVAPDPVRRIGEILDSLLFEAVISDLAHRLMARIEDRTAFLDGAAEVLVDVVDGAFVVLEIGEHGREGTAVVARGELPAGGDDALFAALGVKSTQRALRHDPQARWSSVPALRDAMAPCVPIEAAGRTLGMLTVCGRRGSASMDMRTPLQLVRALAPVVSSFCTLEDVKHIAATDALTGIANRRQGHTVLDREVARAIRYQNALSVILADIDHFKSVNDTYGHAIGDDVLRRTATITARVLRTSDVAVRWGGEELLIVLPHAALGHAVMVAERIRTAVATMSPLPDGPQRVTVSLGVATLAKGDGGWEPLVARADEALYRAKGAGRNRVERQIDP